MCGRYTLTRLDDLVTDLDAAVAVDAQPEPIRAWWKPRFNIAPTQPAPVAVLRHGVRTIELMRWGLLPHWAGKGTSKPPLMINARVETLESKQVFRDALDRHRCLVPADGFFEWRREGKVSHPFYIRPVPRELVAFAGIWTRAGDTYSFAIVTGPASPLVAPLHDRMPIVLDHSQYAAWLDPAIHAHEARALLTGVALDDWRADPISPVVNKAANDDPHCIELIEPPAAPPQGSLF
jgi:putative SOS response-associated peptidase YedK